MDAVVAVLTALAAVAGIVQMSVTLLERSERKRRERVGQPEPYREASSPTRHLPLESERRTNQNSTDSRRVGPQQFDHPRKTAEGKTYGNEPPIEVMRPMDRSNFEATSRSSLAYLFGFIGAFFYRKNRSEKVRFHAAQSTWIDISAVAYLIISSILTGVYVAIRYPGPNAQIPPNDPVMWAWVLTSLLGPPILHVTLAILTMAGRNPRVPLISKIAATVTSRRGDWSELYTQPPRMESSSTQLPLAERPDTIGHHGLNTPKDHISNYASTPTTENRYDHAGWSTVESPNQVSAEQPYAEEVVQPTGREPGWDPFRTERGNEEGSYVTFTSHKWLYWILTPLIFVLGLITLIGALESTSWGTKIVGVIFATFLVFVAIGLGNMAWSPIRLEIGSRGVQLFARSGTTWLPWEVIEAIDIKRLGGTPHVVAWLS